MQKTGLSQLRAHCRHLLAAREFCPIFHEGFKVISTQLLSDHFHGFGLKTQPYRRSKQGGICPLGEAIRCKTWCVQRGVPRPCRQVLRDDLGIAKHIGAILQDWRFPIAPRQLHEIGPRHNVIDMHRIPFELKVTEQRTYLFREQRRRVVVQKQISHSGLQSYFSQRFSRV